MQPEPIFYVQDHNCFRIAQVEYQGRTRNIRIFDSKPLSTLVIPFLFAHFVLNAHQTGHRPKPEKSENWASKNLKLRTDLRDRVMDGWSVTQ